MSNTDPIDAPEALSRLLETVERMEAAFAIDPRLPAILYLRNKGRTIRGIAAKLGMPRSTVDKILKKVDTYRTAAKDVA